MKNFDKEKKKKNRIEIYTLQPRENDEEIDEETLRRTLKKRKRQDCYLYTHFILRKWKRILTKRHLKNFEKKEGNRLEIYTFQPK